nr:hypothetical protein [Endozoicomonas sp.]
MTLNTVLTLCLTLLVLGSSTGIQARISDPVDGPFQLSARSPIDEAFESVTSGNNRQDAAVDWQNQMPEGFQAKRNASYPWATTTFDDREVWVGTISQGWCVWPIQNLDYPFYLSTYQSKYTGCSPQSVLTSNSHIYIYNFETGTRELVNEQTLTSGGERFKKALQPHDEMSFFSIMGLRAAGTYKDLVFFAGHHLHKDGEGWIRLLVFNARERSFLGYRDIRGDTTRRFKALKDAEGNTGFYTIIGAETGMTQNGNGPTVMLRWVGTPEAPFTGGNYRETLDGEGAGWDVVSVPRLNHRFGMIGDFIQFTHIDGSERLIMSSAAHPLLYDPETGERDSNRNESVMLLSDKMPVGGWTPDNPMGFQTIFSMDRYDPDEKGRWGAKWGTASIHNNALYFGTYHQGTQAGHSHFKIADKKRYKQLTETRQKEQLFLQNQWRASSVFRIPLKQLEEMASGITEPELLYGYERFKVANEEGDWESRPNKMGVKPLFGKAGMGNPGNIYSWTSLSKDGRLFWGFFDAFSGVHDLLAEADSSRLLLYPGFSIPVPFWEYFRDTSPTHSLYNWVKAEMSNDGMLDEFVAGGDLIFFDRDGNPNSLTSNGFGNPCVNGIRNAEELNGRVYFATSTWCNLS